MATDPADHHAHCILGMARRHQGDVAGATAAFACCLEIEPGHSSANYYAALASLKCGDKTEAARRLRIATASDPSHVAAHKQLAHLDWDDAGGAAQKAANANPRDAGCLNSHGLSLLRKGETEEAERAFRAASKEDPAHAGAQYRPPASKKFVWPEFAAFVVLQKN